ncbi:unnamed protein product [Ectocarpus sp. 6 AP-2014]
MVPTLEQTDVELKNREERERERVCVCERERERERHSFHGPRSNQQYYNNTITRHRTQQ